MRTRGRQIIEVPLPLGLEESEEFRDSIRRALWEAYGEYYNRDLVTYGELNVLAEGVIRFLVSKGWEGKSEVGPWNRKAPIPLCRARESPSVAVCEAPATPRLKIKRKKRVK